MNSKLKRIDIQALNEDNFPSKEWDRAFLFFKDRYWRRYFNPLDSLITNSSSEIKNNCGFIVTSIDCILIETLEQYVDGVNETEDGGRAFYNFFQRTDKLNGILSGEKDGGKFHGFIRCGLIHQSMTKQDSVLNIRQNKYIVQWVDEKAKHRGFIIQRTLFHRCVQNAYEKYLKDLSKTEEPGLRANFKKKLLSIVT